jgi:hypothetical protein
MNRSSEHDSVGPVYRFRFFFDAGSGTALWADSAAAEEIWGYAVELGRVPVSQPLRDELAGLVTAYDTSVNWDYPPDPGPWREPQCFRFNQAVRHVLARLRAELGPQWQIQSEFSELHEDPDLDRYLADPARFDRRSHG